MNNHNPAQKPQDFPSIEAFLCARKENFRGSGSLISTALDDTVNGENGLKVLATTRGASAILRKVLHGTKSGVSVYLQSESRCHGDPLFDFASVFFVSYKMVRRWWFLGRYRAVYV